jgi:hypothetical protein
MTRAWSLDAPIGDPFGGPAFGERNEPVTAFFAVATAFETIAAIGAVVSVVGMVTGNSDLAKIGGVMGLVGGFGTMAQGGMFGEGLKSWAGEVNTSWASSTSSNISSAAIPADGATMVDGMTSSQVADMSAPVDAGSLNLADAASVNTAAPGLIEQPTLGVDGVVTGPDTGPTMLAADGSAAGASPLADTAAAAGPSSNSALNIASAGEPVNAMSAAAQQGGNLSAVKAAASTGIDTGASLFDKILKFGKENKELSQVALTGIAGMYQSSEKADALKASTNASNSTAALYDARTAEMQAQAANANAIPSVRGIQATGASPYKQTPVTASGVRPAGLIQSRSM